MLLTALLIIVAGLVAGALAGLVVFDDLGGSLDTLVDAGSAALGWVRATLSSLLSG